MRINPIRYVSLYVIFQQDHHRLVKFSRQFSYFNIHAYKGLRETENTSNFY